MSPNGVTRPHCVKPNAVCQISTILFGEQYVLNEQEGKKNISVEIKTSLEAKLYRKNILDNILSTQLLVSEYP